MLEKDKEPRIDNQYYLKNKPVNINFDELTDFILSIKEILDSLKPDKIKELREKIQKF